MADRSTGIDVYWRKKSPAFSNQYFSVLGVPLTPVGLFLKLRQRKISKLLRPLVGKTLVDVGCGSGVFMKVAIEQGKYPIGVDYSKQMLDTARTNLRNYSADDYKLVLGDATRLSLHKNTADIVLASGLTDYLTTKDVCLFFSEVKRILKVNGYVIITFPKRESIFSFLRSGIGLILRQKLLRLPRMEKDYSRADIMNLFRSAGIKPLSWNSVMGTMWIVLGKINDTYYTT